MPRSRLVYTTDMSDHGIPALVESIYRERVYRARARPVAAKIVDGGELFEYACTIARAGIRSQFPGSDEEFVEAELRRRLDLGRRLERASGVQPS